MADRDLRDLERQALQGDATALERLKGAWLRARALSVVESMMSAVESMTAEDAAVLARVAIERVLSLPADEREAPVVVRQIEGRRCVDLGTARYGFLPRPIPSGPRGRAHVVGPDGTTWVESADGDYEPERPARNPTPLDDPPTAF